ncbi:stomatin-like protein 1 [Lepeophtheirus salmonis]|uniref:stomatin-like protein 1 n=1 Tax=Lepeophtheirus salmonis TaxID=72036 RepID=UPI001AEBA041|nr:stomatin-like protein 1 [Lepeophtheirus salmonis]
MAYLCVHGTHIFKLRFFILTAPVSYWILVKKMGENDRIVIFRLGKMLGVKGPGRVIVFPWMDRTKKVDVRASAFAVPPQQFITADGGIVEMGAEIQYTIVDVVTMISEVADHQEILRSLGKTLLIKTLVKKTVQQLERDKRIPAGEIQDDVNDQVRKWGIDIQAVTLSEPKILKSPDNGSSTAMGSILKGLGMKGESKYPTPEEFVRASHGLETPEGNTQIMGGGMLAPSQPQQPQFSNMSMLQMLSSGAMPQGVNHVQLGPGIVQPQGLPESISGGGMTLGYVGPDKPSSDAPMLCNWGKCLDIILQTEFGSTMEQDACGLYELEISETESGTDKYWLEINPTSKVIKTTNDSGKSPDVSVSLSSPDLSSILEGTLAPLQAYLTGRISASGDVRKLMLFDKLSKRGHKTGAMFSI